jgi:hypothetical protein
MEIYQAAAFFEMVKLPVNRPVRIEQMIEYTHPAKALNTRLPFSV